MIFKRLKKHKSGGQAWPVILGGRLSAACDGFMGFSSKSGKPLPLAARVGEDAAQLAKRRVESAIGSPTKNG